jgi:hypothetical protein
LNCRRSLSCFPPSLPNQPCNQTACSRICKARQRANPPSPATKCFAGAKEV